MIDVKAGQLLPILEALDTLLDRELPILTALRISQLKQVVRTEAVPVDEQRINLVKKYQNGELTPSSEGWPEFEAEFNELMGADVRLAADPIPLGCLPADLVLPGRLLEQMVATGLIVDVE